MAMSDGWYKCDRCGEFERGRIRRSGSNSTYSTDYAEEDYRRVRYGHLTGDDNSVCTSRTIDLCNDCRKALTEWVDTDDHRLADAEPAEQDAPAPFGDGDGDE